MTPSDLEGLDFFQVIAVLVVTFCIKVLSVLIETRGRRRRLAEDIALVERLSALDLSDEERRVLASFRAQTVRELPVKQAGTSGLGVTPTAIVSATWLAIGLFMAFTGVTWVQLFLVALGFVLSVSVAKMSYEMGKADGSLRERENLISAKRLEHERPKKVDDRE